MFKTTNSWRSCHGATLLFALPFLSAGFVTAASGQAPTTTAKLVGVVMEADSREPLSGAFIEVVPLDVRARTDRQGRYELSGLPAGKYTVVVRMIGRVVRRESIELRAGAETVLDVPLETGVVRLPAIEVLRSRTELGRNLDDIPGSVHVVVDEEITQRNPFHDVHQTLRRVPGAVGYR